MNAPLCAIHAEPFFFDTELGQRFALFHAPDPRTAPRGAILYLHPFAEEMNKSRRMAALQSRAFAAAGFAVLQFDLFGCGDSCGDFAAARWEIWLRDVSDAMAVLRARSKGPFYLWGLRLGGLLALDWAGTNPVDGALLWQPCQRGRSCIDQFLRIRLAQALFEGDAICSTAGLREQMRGHGSIEIAGYELAADLAHAIEAVEMDRLRPQTPRIEWLATSGVAPSSSATAVARLTACWPCAAVRFRHVAGPPFWATTEIAESPALIAASTAVFDREFA